MANPDNFFKPGQSGNLKGRPPRDWTWSGLLEEVAEELDPKDKKTFKRKVAEGLIRQAIKGDHSATKVLFDRMDGMPKQSTDLTTNGKDLQPLLVKFINDKSDRDTD